MAKTTDTSKTTNATAGVGARDSAGTTTPSGAKRVGPAAPEKATGHTDGQVNVEGQNPSLATQSDSAPGPAQQSGPGAPGFIVPAVGGMESATFSAGGTPVTPVTAAGVVPVIQDDDVPVGQSPVNVATEGVSQSGDQSTAKKSKTATASPVKSDARKSVDSKKHK